MVFTAAAHEIKKSTFDAHNIFVQNSMKAARVYIEKKLF